MDSQQLVDAIATILASAHEEWAWRPDGPAYTDSEVAVVYGALPSAPNRAIGITPYIARDDPATGLAIRRVQLRFRGNPRNPNGADALADAAFTTLQGLARVAGLNLVTRESSAPLGADLNDRQERSDNYQIILDNPEATP